MSSLINEYWKSCQKKIILKSLAPWIAYSIVSIIYFAKSLEAGFESIEGNELNAWRACAGCVIILTIYQLYNEV